MDAHHGLARRPGGETEDLARYRVQPRAFEVNALLLLDREVALVGLAQLLRRDSDEPAMDIHKRRHVTSLTGADDRPRRVDTVDAAMRSVIGHLPDVRLRS